MRIKLNFHTVLTILLVLITHHIFSETKDVPDQYVLLEELQGNKGDTLKFASNNSDELNIAREDMAFEEWSFENTNISDGFRIPGKNARPRGFWNWLNGDITKYGITRDMEEAKSKGFGGLVIWDSEAMRDPDGMIPAGPAFMGDESVELIHHAMSEAKRLDMTLGLIPSSGWNSGGTWVTPEMASKNLFYTTTAISGPGQISNELPFPEVPEDSPKGPDGMPKWHIDVAVLAWPDSEDKLIPDLSEVLNITGNFNDGELNWSAPPGDWQVARFVCSNNGQHLIAASPNSKGLFIDFFDPEATRFHFEYFFNRLGIPKGGDPSIPLKTLDDDSMELHEGIQWTTKFPDWFQQYHGYDPVSWLPVLLGWTIHNEDESERFQYDYLKTISDLLIYSHFKTGREVCAEYGIQYAAQAGGPGPPIWNSNPVDALKALGNIDIPRGEFWMGNPRQIFLIKQIASASHIYGKRYASAESWTTWRRWRDGLLTRKMLVDRAFTEGLNHINSHIFAHSPVEDGFPGRSYHAGVDMNPQVVWWSKAHSFIDYLSRCSHMLQQGLFVADVAYYYGDQAPNFWPMHHYVPEKPMIDGLGAGYDYDVVNTDVILNRMTVKDGRIVLPDGMSYRILVLPDQKDMPLEVLLKLEEMVRDGATVIGPKPLEVPGLHEYELQTTQMRELAGNMWKEYDENSQAINNYGQGRIVWGYSPQQWLEMESVASDFSYHAVGNAGELDYIHRQTEGSDIYFIRNKSMTPVSADCVFRVKNKTPKIWDPTDGSIREQFIYKTADGRTSMPIDLPPGGSVFVVFEQSPPSGSIASLELANGENNEDLPDEKALSVTDHAATIQCWENGQYVLTNQAGQETSFGVNSLPSQILIEGEWIVEFDPEWGAPAEIKLPELISWTEHPDEGVRYYSGAGIYNKTFPVPDDWTGPGRSVYLDLGDLRELAEVFINGESAGVLWKPPYMLDITSLIRPGNNVMEIEVMNLWINRLAGDMNLPEDERYTTTNIRADGSTRFSPAEPWREQTSGLLGPVRLMPGMEVSVKKRNFFRKSVKD